MTKKHARPKSAQTAASANQDIIGLIETLVGKLVTLETKIDTILGRLPQRPAEAPRQQRLPVAPAPQNRNDRTMHKAVCADCGKDCEVPFKPSPGRSVYCKNCFAARKKEGTFMPRREEKPKIETAEKPAAAAGKKKPSPKKTSKKKK
jgi:CxxC-x17-CxxC domain-containing protein